MPKQITQKEFQEQLKQYYLTHHNKMQFNEMCHYLLKHYTFQTDLTPPQFEDIFNDMSEKDFNDLIGTSLLSIEPLFNKQNIVQESDIIPLNRDVFVIKHYCYTMPQLHSHDYFEMNYIAKGSGHFLFSNLETTLNEGDLCIMSPHSSHDITTHDDSSIYTMMIRKSTFDTAFLSLLSQDRLLADFFREALQDNDSPNYLLFHTKGNSGLKNILRNIIGECTRIDDYSNRCCIDWIYLFFSILLRHYKKTAQLYRYQLSSDFSLIMQYLQHHYRTITLSMLAREFHYSEAYMSQLIKLNTNQTFSQMIKKLKLEEALHYLVYTDLKIYEIAELVGYHSADHFSRVFRQVYYPLSPLEYRKHHQS